MTLTAILALGWVVGAPSLAAGHALTYPHGLAATGNSANDYAGTWGVDNPNPTLALGDRMPILPAGPRVRSAPAGEMQGFPVTIPVQPRRSLLGRQVSGAELDHVTEKLQSLLKAVQPELREASKGELPRDLIPHLKRIEKLSKQLRRQLSE
jgi:hypothetical protein